MDIKSSMYVGWWSAASFHGFTTQKPATVFVVVRRRTKARTIEGAEIRFVKVEPRKFFGAKRYSVYGRSTNISDPEKTVIDCIDRPDLAGGGAELARIVHTAMAEIDQTKLVDAAMPMKSTSLLQRLGWLVVEPPATSGHGILHSHSHTHRSCYCAREVQCLR